jgi:energy-coupling factor transport system permease protein
VVVSRRGDAVWALGLRYYLVVGGFVVGMRVAFRVVFGGGSAGTVLVRLPAVPLPAWAAGLHLFGPVSAQSLLAGAYDGLRLATMLVCLGAANCLANPKRLLKSVPSALYEVGTAVVVALSLAPQLVDSVARVRRARRLRGAAGRGAGALRGFIVPVLEDALDRSRALAAAMDSRGYGRTDDQPRSARRVTGALVLGGLMAVCVGVYGALDGSTPQLLGAPVLAAGLLSAAGMWVSGRRVARTRYRPDPWLRAEWFVAATGLLAAAGSVLAARVDAADLNPGLDVLTWPQLPLLAAAGVLVAVLPAWATPAPRSTVPSPPAASRTGVDVRGPAAPAPAVSR